MARTYFVRTFGCQMNEHDSERIAGLLEADGLTVAAVRRRRRRGRAQHVLHPRERRQQALRQPRPPEVDQGRASGHADRRRRLSRPERPRPRADEGATRRRGARHPQRAPRRRTGRAWRARRPRGRDPRRPRSDDDGVPLGSAGTARGRRTPRGSRSRSAATTPARSASCRRCAGPRSAGRSRPSSPRSRRWRPTASPRSRCSARTSTPTAATSPSRLARPAATIVSARCSPTCSAPSAGVPASAASATRARIRKTSGPTRSRPWPPRRRCASTCTTRCSPAPIACSRPCTAATPPSAIWPSWPTPGAASPIWPSRPTSSSGFPGETEADFERTLEVVAAAEYDCAYTFIFSPRPGTEAAGMIDRFVDPAIVRRTVRPTAGRRRAIRPRQARARVGRVEEVLVEGPSKKDPTVLSGRTRQNKLVHVRPDRPLRAGTYVTAEITDAAPHHLVGRLVDVVALPTHTTRIPVMARSSCRASPSSARRRRGSRHSQPRTRVRPRASSWSRSIPCRYIAVWTSARRSRPRPSRPRSPHHCLDLAEPDRGSHRRSLPGRRSRRSRGDRRSRSSSRCSSVAAVCTCGRSSTISIHRVSGLRCAPKSTQSPTRSRCTAD